MENQEVDIEQAKLFLRQAIIKIRNTWALLEPHSYEREALAHLLVYVENALISLGTQRFLKIALGLTKI